MTARRRLAIVVSHPIQHFVPFYRALAADPDVGLHVLFGSRMGLESYYDAEMRTEIKWKMDMLGGYPHAFLSDDPTRVGVALKALRPDAVLVYGYNQRNAQRALLWCRRHRVPALMLSDSEPLTPRARWKALLKDVIVRRVFGLCSAFLSVGDNNEAYYRAYGAKADRIFRAPFTIDEAAYRDARARRADLRAELRKELGIPADARVALFVGKLSARKRPQDLLDALQFVPGIHALFAGNGELAEALKAHTRARGLAAHFAGFVNVDRLPALFAAADILVQPSQADPHPLVCSEAACVGLPMILSDRIGAAGPTDIARPGENAIVYPCGDAAALARALDHVCGDDDRLREMSEASARIFEDQDVRRSVAGVKAALAAVTGGTA